jgi:uncharacterized membrane protein YkoI
MFKLIERLFGHKPTNIRTRLSADQALAIARSATADDSLSRHLGPVKLEDRSGTPVWIVSSATVGQMLEVSIDDATGKVLEAHHVGVR